MAAMAAHTPTSTGGSPQPPTSEEPKLGVPSRNPLPLSASQEAQVRDVFYARVRRACADEIKGEDPLFSPFPSILWYIDSLSFPNLFLDCPTFFDFSSPSCYSFSVSKACVLD